MGNSSNQRAVLIMLADGQFHSGEDMGGALSISRTGIWKIIQSLELLGIEIHRVQGKGYRLPQKVELLDSEQVLSALDSKTRNKLSMVDIFLTCESTNSYLMSLHKSQGASKKAAQPSMSNDGHVCLAEMQTQGRGRRGRKWVSPFGGNVYMSLLWHFSTDPYVLSSLGLALSVAITRALKQLGIADVMLKWPNDVMWNNRKLAGTLVEMVAESTGPCRVVIGTGVNLNLHGQTAREIDQPWVDIKTILGYVPSRNKIAGLLLQEIINVIDDFEQHGLAGVVDEWRRHDAYAGNVVDLHLHQDRIRGKCEGIDDMGALILRRENGHVQKFTSGEISLRAVST